MLTPWVDERARSLSHRGAVSFKQRKPEFREPPTPVAGRVRRACDDAPLSFPVRLCDAPDLLVPSSRIVLFVLVVIPVVEGLLSVVDALSLYDLPGAGFSCINLPRPEVFPAKYCALVS